MTTNIKFISLLLGEENFADEFTQFSEEEQSEFIDFFCDVSVAGIKALKAHPTQERTPMLLAALNRMPKDALKEMVQVFLVLDDES